MIFKDVCSKPSCTLLFSGENRTCRTTQSCANPLCGRLWNSTRLSGSWNVREERVEGSSRSPLFGQNYNDNSPCHQQPTDSSGESMAPLGLLHVWKSSKRMSPKYHPEPGTRNFCFARTFAIRLHFWVLAPYIFQSTRQLRWHLHKGCELQATTHQWQHKPAFCCWKTCFLCMRSSHMDLARQEAGCEELTDP